MFNLLIGIFIGILIAYSYVTIYCTLCWINVGNSVILLLKVYIIKYLLIILCIFMYYQPNHKSYLTEPKNLNVVIQFYMNSHEIYIFIIYLDD